MIMIEKCFIITESGREVAEIAIRDIEEGWYYGEIVNDHFLDGERKALHWYADVVEGQMLSFLDEALAAVDGLQLRVRLSETQYDKLYSLHLTKGGEVSFRTTPVPPAADKPKVERGK